MTSFARQRVLGKRGLASLIPQCRDDARHHLIRIKLSRQASSQAMRGILRWAPLNRLGVQSRAAISAIRVFARLVSTLLA